MGITPVTLMADVPFVSVPLSQEAILNCCYITKDKPGTPAWVFQHSNRNMIPIPVNASDLVIIHKIQKFDESCGVLTLKAVQLNDSGLYQCSLTTTGNSILSHGTYLQVYSECFCMYGGGGVLFAVHTIQKYQCVCVCVHVFLKWRPGVK